jgi:hypothetical protein
VHIKRQQLVQRFVHTFIQEVTVVRANPCSVGHASAVSGAKAAR